MIGPTKKEMANRLADERGIWFTRHEYATTSEDDMTRLYNAEFQVDWVRVST